MGEKGASTGTLKAVDKESVVQSSPRNDLRAVKVFSKLKYFIFGFFDPTNNFFDNKNK